MRHVVVAIAIVQQLVLRVGIGIGAGKGGAVYAVVQRVREGVVHVERQAVGQLVLRLDHHGVVARTGTAHDVGDGSKHRVGPLTGTGSTLGIELRGVARAGAQRPLAGWVHHRVGDTAGGGWQVHIDEIGQAATQCADVAGTDRGVVAHLTLNG